MCGTSIVNRRLTAVTFAVWRQNASSLFGEWGFISSEATAASNLPLTEWGAGEMGMGADATRAGGHLRLGRDGEETDDGRPYQATQLGGNGDAERREGRGEGEHVAAPKSWKWLISRGLMVLKCAQGFLRIGCVVAAPAIGLALLVRFANYLTL